MDITINFIEVNAATPLSGTSLTLSILYAEANQKYPWIWINSATLVTLHYRNGNSEKDILEFVVQRNPPSCVTTEIHFSGIRQ